MNTDRIRLTQLSNAAGCAAKLKATELQKVLSNLTKIRCDNLEVGYDGAEDALVYNLNDNTALVSTVDFFPPMVDDPFAFGQVAAANAISDIYAMGGDPLYALSLLCFPEKLPKTILQGILEGGIAKASEAGIPIAGGHTIDDPIVKYGLAVTGRVEKGKFWRNNTVKLGDALVLTKTLGVGIINTAVKCGEASEGAMKKAVESMQALNKNASLNAKKFRISAATDVTGFGLLGHLSEMMGENKYTAIIDSESVPYFDEAKEYAEFGLLPCGLYNNKEYTAGKVEIKRTVPVWLSDILYDPQTSGGLLFSMNKNDAKEYVKAQEGAVVIGEIAPKQNVSIMVE